MGDAVERLSTTVCDILRSGSDARRVVSWASRRGTWGRDRAGGASVDYRVRKKSGSASRIFCRRWTAGPRNYQVMWIGVVVRNGRRRRLRAGLRDSQDVAPTPLRMNTICAVTLTRWMVLSSVDTGKISIQRFGDLHEGERARVRPPAEAMRRTGEPGGCLTLSISWSRSSAWSRFLRRKVPASSSADEARPVFWTRMGEQSMVRHPDGEFENGMGIDVVL